MKKIKILVLSALIVSSMTVLTACGKNSKVEESTLTDAAVEETEAEVEEEKPAEEKADDNKEEVKEEVAKIEAESVKENKNAVSNSTSTATNDVQNNTNSKEPAKKPEPQKQAEQPQKKQESPKYRLGDVVPAPDGEVYKTNINGAPGTTTVRRVVSIDGVICIGSESAEFTDTYTIQDPSVVKLNSQYKVDDYYSKQYYGLDIKLIYHEYKGLRQGRTKVTHKTINKSTGEVWDSTDYYMEVDSNLKLYIFLPGNGIEN